MSDAVLEIMSEIERRLSENAVGNRKLLADVYQIARREAESRPAGLKADRDKLRRLLEELVYETVPRNNSQETRWSDAKVYLMNTYAPGDLIMK